MPCCLFQTSAAAPTSHQQPHLFGTPTWTEHTPQPLNLHDPGALLAELQRCVHRLCMGSMRMDPAWPGMRLTGCVCMPAEASSSPRLRTVPRGTPRGHGYCLTSLVKTVFQPYRFRCNTTSCTCVLLVL